MSVRSGGEDMSRRPLIGVLALQGDVREHQLMLERLGALVREVRRPADLNGLDGLVLPGGESTAIARLMAYQGLDRAIRVFADAGRPIYGSCAGLVLLARETAEGGPPTLGLMDIAVRRNAWGRQPQSFEAALEVAGLEGGPLTAVFIRAPWIERAGRGVHVLARHHGHIVAARQGNILVGAFHPELTGDARFHALYLSMLPQRRGDRAPQDPRGCMPRDRTSDPLLCSSDTTIV